MVLYQSEDVKIVTIITIVGNVAAFLPTTVAACLLLINDLCF